MLPNIYGKFVYVLTRILPLNFFGGPIRLFSSVKSFISAPVPATHVAAPTPAPTPATAPETDTFLKAGAQLFPVSGPHCIDDRVLSAQSLCFAIVEGIDDEFSPSDPGKAPETWFTSLALFSSPTEELFGGIQRALTLYLAFTLIAFTIIALLFAHLIPAAHWPLLADRLVTALALYWHYSVEHVSLAFLQDMFADVIKFWRDEVVQNGVEMVEEDTASALVRELGGLGILSLAEKKGAESKENVKDEVKAKKGTDKAVMPSTSSSTATLADLPSSSRLQDAARRLLIPSTKTFTVPSSTPSAGPSKSALPTPLRVHYNDPPATAFPLISARATSSPPTKGAKKVLNQLSKEYENLGAFSRIMAKAAVEEGNDDVSDERLDAEVKDDGKGIADGSERDIPTEHKSSAVSSNASSTAPVEASETSTVTTSDPALVPSVEPKELVDPINPTSTNIPVLSTPAPAAADTSTWTEGDTSAFDTAINGCVVVGLSKMFLSAALDSEAGEGCGRDLDLEVDEEATVNVLGLEGLYGSRHAASTVDAIPHEEGVELDVSVVPSRVSTSLSRSSRIDVVEPAAMSQADVRVTQQVVTPSLAPEEDVQRPGDGETVASVSVDGHSLSGSGTASCLAAQSSISADRRELRTACGALEGIVPSSVASVSSECVHSAPGNGSYLSSVSNLAMVSPPAQEQEEPVVSAVHEAHPIISASANDGRLLTTPATLPPSDSSTAFVTRSIATPFNSGTDLPTSMHLPLSAHYPHVDSPSPSLSIKSIYSPDILVSPSVSEVDLSGASGRPARVRLPTAFEALPKIIVDETLAEVDSLGQPSAQAASTVQDSTESAAPLDDGWSNHVMLSEFSHTDALEASEIKRFAVPWPGNALAEIVDTVGAPSEGQGDVLVDEETVGSSVSILAVELVTTEASATQAILDLYSKAPASGEAPNYADAGLTTFAETGSSSMAVTSDGSNTASTLEAEPLTTAPTAEDTPLPNLLYPGFCIAAYAEVNAASCSSKTAAAGTEAAGTAIPTSTSAGRAPSFIALSLKDMYAKSAELSVPPPPPAPAKLSLPFRAACKAIFPSPPANFPSPTPFPTPTKPKHTANHPSTRTQTARRRYCSDGPAIQMRVRPVPSLGLRLGLGERVGVAALDPARVDLTCAFAFEFAFERRAAEEEERIARLERDAVADDASAQPFHLAKPKKVNAVITEKVVTAEKENAAPGARLGALAVAPDLALAGIVVTEAGDRIVPAQLRPDGSMRKALKIRPGFVAQEAYGKYLPPPVRTRTFSEAPRARARTHSESSSWGNGGSRFGATFPARASFAPDSPSLSENWRGASPSPRTGAFESPKSGLARGSESPRFGGRDRERMASGASDFVVKRKMSQEVVRSRPASRRPSLEVLRQGSPAVAATLKLPALRETEPRVRVRTASAKSAENVAGPGPQQVSDQPRERDKSGQIVLPAGSGWKGRAPRTRQPTAAPGAW